MSSDRTKAFAVNLETAGYDKAKAKKISEVCAAAALDLEDETMFETYKSGVLLTCADADFATALETMLDESGKWLDRFVRSRRMQRTMSRV